MYLIWRLMDPNWTQVSVTGYGSVQFLAKGDIENGKRTIETKLIYRG